MPPKKLKQSKKAAAIAAPTNGTTPEPEGSVGYFKQQGNVAFAASRFNEAVEAYNHAIDAASEESNTEKAKLYSNRCAAYLGMSPSNLDAALADAEACISLDSSWAKGYFRKGMVLRAMDRVEEACAVFLEGQTLQPDNSEIVKALKEANEVLVRREIERDTAESPDKDKFSELVDWLLQGGAQFPDLYMKRYSENHRGVHCRANVPENNVIMRIPKQYLITVEMGKATPIGKKMVAGRVDLTASKHCYLCVYVMWDRRNATSFFQPYYRILPSSYDNMPIFWEEDDLVYLDGSYMLRQIEDRKANIKADYDEICRHAPEFSEYSLQEFEWARMMVASRNFGVNVDDIKTDALVPFADMLNHLRPRQTKWTYEQTESSFTITSLQSLEMGQQVYDSYGKKCNSRFLLNYGFAVADNRDPDGRCHNEVRFYLDLDKSDEGLGFKLSLLGRDLSGKGMRVSMNHDDQNSMETLSYCRFICAKGNEILLLPRLEGDYDLQENPIQPLSLATEMRVLELLDRMSTEQLSRYPTTLEEDTIRLQDYNELPEFSNRRGAVILVRGEKEVCHYWIRASQVCRELSMKEWKDAKKYLAKLPRDDALTRYLEKVIVPLIKKQAMNGG